MRYSFFSTIFKIAQTEKHSTVNAIHRISQKAANKPANNSLIASPNSLFAAFTKFKGNAHSKT